MDDVLQGLSVSKPQAKVAKKMAVATNRGRGGRGRRKARGGAASLLVVPKK